MPRVSAYGIIRSHRRLLPLLAAALLLAIPARVHAQCRILENGGEWCDDGSGPGGDNVPYVQVKPGSLRTGQPVVPVTIEFRDDNGLVDSTFQVRVNGTSQAVSFNLVQTASGTGPARIKATATGLVRLSETGPTTVEARICDNAPERQCVTSYDPVTFLLTLPGVAVTPDGDSTVVAKGARTRTFVVRNTGTDTATFYFTSDCRNALTGLAAGGCGTPAPVTLAAGASQNVQVAFTAVAGEPLSIGVTARQAGAPGVHDAGWMNATVYGAGGAAQAAPLIGEVDLNTGASAVLRGQCVTVSAGPGAAYECGDLRLAHALPAHRTFSRTWAPVLLYNSQHADPRPTVYYDVTLPEGAVVPADFLAVLYLDDTGQTVQVSFPGSQWQPGTTRRVAVQFDGASRPTGRYGYHFQVIARGPGWQVSSRVANSSIDIVNRLYSPFGSGWWLAGLESLLSLPGGASLLWTGGDGSTLRFDPGPAGSTWTARPPDGPPETLTLVPGSHYVRQVPGGGEIHFDLSGRHLRTVNRLGQTTRFNWQSGRLTRIEVPVPGGGTGPAYDFVYDAYGVLARVDATMPTAPTRSVHLPREPGGGSRVMSIQDPDGHTVSFGYDLPGRVFVATRRTDRRGTPVRFAFSPSGRLVSTHLPLAPGDTIVRRFEPVEDRGIGVSVAQSHAFTLLDGPRTDVIDRTWIWPAARGAPRRIRDAMGGETVITRGDPDFAALATEVVGPGGVRTTAVYDDRGRVSERVVHNPLGDGRSVRTRYTYDDRWDAPTEVRTEGVDGSGAATPLAGAGYATYDAMGNPLTRRQGLDDTHQVRFTYYPAGHPHAGLAASVTGAQDAAGRRGRDSLVYDAQGNLARTISPAGFLALIYRDGLGRDTLTITPIDSAKAVHVDSLRASGVRVRTEYDVMDRPTRTERIGPARAYVAVNAGFAPAPTPRERLEVVTAYDAEGAPGYVGRFSTPDYDGGGGFVTEYTYDPAGRVVRDSGQAGVQRFTRDHAGNVTTTRTAAGFDVLVRYDAIGRPLRRTVPERAYAGACRDLLLTVGCNPVPVFPSFGTGYKVPEEWHHYRYDAAGSQVYAENADARVQRTYYPNGAVQTDSSWIRAAEDVAYAAFGLRYTYDLAGRVTSLEHPRNLAGGSVRPDSFAYHPVTGALSRATSRLLHTFDFHHAPNGALTSLRQPGAIVDSLRYDVEGRLAWRTESGPAAGVLHEETMRYDARGKLLHASNPDSEFHNWYSSLGVLVGTDWYNLTQNVVRIAEELRTDPLGSTALRLTNLDAEPTGAFAWFENVYQAGTGRLLASRRLPPLNPSGGFVQDSTIPATTRAAT